MEKKEDLPLPDKFITSSASYVTFGEVSRLCDIHPKMIIRLVQYGLIDPAEKEKIEDAWTFPVETVQLVRKIIRLRKQLGINYSGIGVILELLSRIEALEARIRELSSR